VLPNGPEQSPSASKQLSVGDELQRLSDYPEFADRRDGLVELAAALTGGPDRPRWAEIDLFSAFNVDGASTTHEQDSIVAQRLARLLSVLIFVPVLLTWIGLATAGLAYRSLLAEDPAAATQSFLKLWYGGFEGHTALRLDRIAFFTIGILLLVILVSFLLNRQRERDSAGADLRGRAFGQQLRAAVTRASLALVDHRQSSPDQIRQRIAAATDQLGNVVQQSRHTAQLTTMSLEQMRTSLEQVKLIAETFETGVQLSARAANTIASASERVNQSVVNLDSGIRQTFSELAAENAAALTTSADRMADAVNGLSSGLEEPLSAVTDGSRTMADAAEMARNSMTAMDTGVRGVLTALEQNVVNQMANLEVANTSLKQGLSESLAGAGTELYSKIADSLAGLRAGVEAAGHELAGHVRSSGQELTEQVRSSNQEVVEQVKSSGEELGADLKSSGEELAAHLQSSNDDLLSQLAASSSSVSEASEAVLSQAAAAVSWSEKTYAEVCESFTQMTGRLTDVASQEGRANDLLTAHGEAVAQLASLVNSITALHEQGSVMSTQFGGMSNQFAVLSTQLGEGEKSAEDRADRRNTLQLEQAAMLKNIFVTTEHLAVMVQQFIKRPQPSKMSPGPQHTGPQHTRPQHTGPPPTAESPWLPAREGQL
jgi:hypothetical protein